MSGASLGGDRQVRVPATAPQAHNGNVARPAERLLENVPGEFYIDASCIDCETCMVLAPATFAESAAELAFVHRQPQSAAERDRALMALVSCPTASIGTLGRRDASAAARAFPAPFSDNVYTCGYASPRSYGAQSWLLRRPQGNVLIDSPRAAAPLLSGMARLGGVRLMLLTHQDDVADHARFRERFACDRVMHEGDLSSDTAGVERRVAGYEPVELAPDLLILPVPGHTRGSIALLHGDILFTGDHLWAEPDGTLAASRSVCWWSWPEQVRSLQRLLDYDFRMVLPGHGRPFVAETPAAARRALEALLERVR